MKNSFRVSLVLVSFFVPFGLMGEAFLFSSQQRGRIGVHTCPGGDQAATHSADVDYAGLPPTLFRLHARRFYVQLASEKDPER